MEQRPPSRFDLLVSDPGRYFEGAWQRASEQVDRQIERERILARGGGWCSPCGCYHLRGAHRPS